MPKFTERLASFRTEPELTAAQLYDYVNRIDPGPMDRFQRAARADYPYSMDGQGMRQALEDELQRMDEGMEGQTLDQAAVATAGVPILGDAVGLAADAKAVYDDPSWMNIGGAALGALPFVPAMAAIRAYHGSPHDFDRFDMSKIGTGEGAQAYGHGLYFAGNEDVAKSYQAHNSATAAMRYNGKPIKDEARKSVAWYLFQHDGDKGAVLAQWRQMYRPEYFDTPTGKRELRELERMDYSRISPGRMYEVNINADPDDFLDWDRPLSEQPRVAEKFGYTPEHLTAHKTQQTADTDALLAALEGDATYTAPQAIRLPGAPSLTSTGADIVRGAASEPAWALQQRGLPGIKYLDQGSRAAGEGSRNYVVFDDKLIDIVRKYGIGALLGGTGAFGLMSLQGEDGTEPPL